MLTNILLRQIPTSLLAELEAGTLGLYGSTIREVATGRIAGFLQETTGLSQLAQIVTGGMPTSAVDGLASLLQNVPGVGAVVNMAGHAATNVQLHQVKAALASVQSLQVANLALGAAGIGVSIAGFAVLAHKIGRIEQQVSAMGDRLDRIVRSVEALRQEPIRQDFTRLKTVAEQLDEGWTLASPASQWDVVARDSHALIDSFDRRASELLQASDVDPLAVDPFLEALALAVATRVTARLAAGDDLAARRAAADGTARLTALGSRLRLSELALARIGADVATGTPAWKEALALATDELRPIIASVRQREIAADSTLATLAELGRREITGRAWLEAARAETDAPLLCLLPGA